MKLAKLSLQWRFPGASRCLRPQDWVISPLVCLYCFHALALLPPGLAPHAEPEDTVAGVHCTHIRRSIPGMWRSELISWYLQRGAAPHLTGPLRLKRTRAKAPGSSTWLYSGKKGSSPRISPSTLLCVIRKRRPQAQPMNWQSFTIPMSPGIAYESTAEA